MNDETARKKLALFQRLYPDADVEKGICNCAGSAEFYIELLRDYAAGDHRDFLGSCFTDENWHDYSIKVHALKSNSRSLGFLVLGDLCERLQDAAEREDAAFLRENHPIMVKILTKIVESIQICFP